MKENTKITFLFLVGLATRLLAFPYAQVVDADATTRIFIAEGLLKDFRLITEGVWLPLHHYVNAFAILVSGEHHVGPILMHILFASFTVIPIYHFTKREFSCSGAWFAALFYVLCPVVFRNSFHALSGIPYAFFIACSLNYLSKALRSGSWKDAVLAGTCITLAAGFRYEAWVLIALFTGIVAYRKKWKLLIYFWLSAMIFPAFWMVGNYLAHEDIFFGLTGAYNWNIVISGVNEHVSEVERIKRLIFFPFSWLFLYSPLVVGVLLVALVKNHKKGILDRSKVVWVIPFIVMLIIFIYKSYGGTLLKQHRFTTSLILLSAPFTALIFAHVKWNLWKRLLTAILIVSLLPMSYYWMEVKYERYFGFSYSLSTAIKSIRFSSVESIKAVPRLKDQKMVALKDKINSNLDPSDGLLLDFLTWEETYYLALESDLNREQIYMVNGAKNGRIYLNKIEELIHTYPEGVALLKCGSKLSEVYENHGNLMVFQSEKDLCIRLTPIIYKENYGVFRYEKYACSKQSFSSKEKSIFRCP